MLKSRRPKNQKGFTLIELLSVLVIMSVMVSVAIKKFDLLSDTAGTNALRAGIRELNTREALVWAKIKLSDTGWSNDVDVFNQVNKNIGPGFSWNPIPDISSGGTLHYQSTSIALLRTGSTRNSAGFWR